MNKESHINKIAHLVEARQMREDQHTKILDILMIMSCEITEMRREIEQLKPQRVVCKPPISEAELFEEYPVASRQDQLSAVCSPDDSHAGLIGTAKELQ